MGSAQFFEKAKGQYIDAKAAFLALREKAQYDYGHAGYTGTIAEKEDFRMVEVPKGKDPKAFASDCFDKSEGEFWDDKWGPAACVEVTGKWLKEERGEQYKGVRNFKVFYFFGWASQ